MSEETDIEQIRVGGRVEVRHKHADCCTCTYEALIARAPYHPARYLKAHYLVDVMPKKGAVTSVDVDDVDVYDTYTYRAFSTFEGKQNGRVVAEGETKGLSPEAVALWVAQLVEHNLVAMHGTYDTEYWKIHLTCTTNTAQSRVLLVKRTRRIQIDHAVVDKVSL